MTNHDTTGPSDSYQPSLHESDFIADNDLSMDYSKALSDAKRLGRPISMKEAIEIANENRRTADEARAKARARDAEEMACPDCKELRAELKAKDAALERAAGAMQRHAKCCMGEYDPDRGTAEDMQALEEAIVEVDFLLPK